MLRRTLTILSLVGLLLSLGLWGSSAHDRDLHIGIYRFLFLRDGLIVYGHLTDHEAVDITRQQILVKSDGGGLQISYGRLEMLIPGPNWLPDFHRFSLGPNYGSGYILFLHLGTAVVVFGLLLSWSWFVPLHRRRKRKKLGLCVKCGYDLRASKDRCPECGTGSEKS